MTELDVMLAAYAANYPDETDRLMLADCLEERGDPRGAWLRDPALASVMGLGLHDPRAKLIENLATDPDAAELLARMGSANLVPLIERLRSDDPRVQKDALTALGKHGETAAPAVPAILALLREDREEIRCAAIETLGRLGSAAARPMWH